MKSDRESVCVCREIEIVCACKEIERGGVNVVRKRECVCM